MHSDYDPGTVPLQTAPDVLRMLVDTVDDIIYALALAQPDQPLAEARVTFVNNRICDVLGYAPEEFVSDPSLWSRLIHKEDLALVAASNREILEHRRPGRRYFRLRHKKLGQYLWFDDNVVPQFGPDGAMTGVIGAARDVTARKRVTQQMAVLLENTRDALLTLDATGCCTYANPAAGRMFRQPVAALVGEILCEQLNEPERSNLRRNCERAAREGMIVRASGFCNSLGRWIDSAIFPTPDGTMIHFRDVTEQRTSEERLRTWVDDAPVALFRSVPLGQMLDANGTAITMLGYPSVEALREKNSTDLIVETGTDGAPSLDLASFDRVSGMPITLRRMDGSHLPVLMNLRAIRDHSGEAIEMLGSFEDRSDPATLRSALLSTARRYRILFNENVTPMVVTAADGTILSQNLAFLRLVGESGSADAEPNGRLADYLSHPASGANLIERAQADGRVEGVELTLRRVDGATRRVLASARVASETRDTAFVETSFVDIEDRSRIEDQLRRTLQEREFLMRELHHRVKNNLQLISSLLSLQARETGEPLLHDFAQKTRDRIMAMAVVHERLYRTDGLGSACIQEYLKALVRNLADSHDADLRGISLEVDGACVETTLDQTMQCGLIVNELVMNALKHAFGDEGGRVRVHVSHDSQSPSRITITVSDTGRGLGDGFDPKATQTLGVQMIENLARQAGGSVRWSSGAGTTVSFELQLTEASEERHLF